MGNTVMKCNYPAFPVAVQEKNRNKEKKGGKRFFRRAHFFPKKMNFTFTLPPDSKRSRNEVIIIFFPFLNVQ
jgi:hypothetical protein